MGSLRIFQFHRLHNFRSAVFLTPFADNLFNFHSNTDKQVREISRNVGFVHLGLNLESSNCHAMSSSRFYASSSNESGSTSLYDALELSPNANQLQIKEAYFRLSKKYHPDRNKSKNAAAKFNEISQAYEILGKPTTRRVYDKGIIKAHDPRAARTGFTRTSSHNQAGFEYKDTHDAKQRRSTGQPHTGKTPIYDYDEWLRMHYSETKERRQRERMHNSNIHFFYKDTSSSDSGMQKVEGATLFVASLVFLYLVYVVGRSIGIINSSGTKNEPSGKNQR